MLDFRKALVAVATLALAGAAFGQTIPQATIGAAPNWSSIEGTTELLPNVVVTIAPAYTYTATGSLTFTLTANVPFTNITPSSSSSALDVFAYDNNSDGPTADQGTVTLTSPTTVQVTFSSIPAGTITTLTIVGLRVNASVVPAPQITIAAGNLPAGGINFTSTTAVVASYPVATLNSLTDVGFTNSPLGTFTNPKGNATLQPVITVGFNGNEPTLLKTKANYTAAYGVIAPIVGTEPTATAAAQGTRLAVTFTNLDSNVSYWVPATIGDGTLVLTAYTAATGNTAASATTFTASLPTPATTLANASTASVTLVPLPTPTNGSTTIYYGVTTGEGAAGSVPLFGTPGPLTWQTPASVGTDLVVFETVPSTAAVTSVSASGPGVSISLVGVTSGYPQFSSTAPAYTANQGSNVNNGLITLNSTTLLFPYVTNTGGYDTGIAITNASTIPTSATSSIATATSSATCTATFYGTGAPSTNPYAVGTVTAGTISTFDVATVAPGFSGYIVVVCNFTGGHGYAFISNGLGTGNGVAANYVAPVIGETGIGAGLVAE